MPVRERVPDLTPSEVVIVLFIGDGKAANKEDGFTDGARVASMAEQFSKPFLSFDPMFKLMDERKILEQPKGTRANRFRLTAFGEQCYEHYSPLRAQYGVEPIAKKSATNQPNPKTETAPQTSQTNATTETDPNSSDSRSEGTGQSDTNGAGGSSNGRKRPHRS